MDIPTTKSWWGEKLRTAGKVKIINKGCIPLNTQNVISATRVLNKNNEN